jgi:hypothetical protein
LSIYKSKLIFFTPAIISQASAFGPPKADGGLENPNPHLFVEKTYVSIITDASVNFRPFSEHL